MVGNAAVTRMLAREGLESAGPTARPAPVQRSAVPEVLRSAGRPLDAPTRTEMEARLGADFSSVRVHDGPLAQRSAAEIGARAYTSGEHVVIGPGGRDRHTLAHELTHVIQQRSGPVSGTDNGAGLRISDPGDRFERAAEDNARRALAGPVPGAAAPHADGPGHEPAAGMVQRAVGFEFETGMETLAADPGLRQSERRGERIIKQFTTRGSWEGRDAMAPDSTEYMGRGLRKKERLVTVANLFTMEADEAFIGGSDLEFVTEAFPETDQGRERLVEAMRRISGVTAHLAQAQRPFDAGELAGLAGGTAEQVPDRSGQATGKQRGPVEKLFKAFPAQQYVVKVIGGITANPQTTAGVRLSRIPQLIHEITPSPQPAGEQAPPHPMSQMDLKKVQATAAQRVNAFLGNGFRVPSADPSRAPAEPSDRLRGLLTLIATYLIGGDASRGEAYLKGIAPLLARTDFAAMYAQLPQEERENFAGDPEIFADVALRAAGLPTADAPVYAGNIGAGSQVNIRHLTRRIWLRGMVGGEDLMSAAGYRNHDWGRTDNDQLATEFESMGSYGAQTDPGNMPILELRRMRKNVPHQEWAQLALAAFDIIRQVNNG
ncbi:eCIS core domain-containing protein [Streptomyces cinerochromogenes]|uniref:eCIS core domain-containing protein n=1 Tax=Streptomyces cinerochromogenes TaxID=66422 RepID=UPI003F53E7DA